MITSFGYVSHGKRGFFLGFRKLICIWSCLQKFVTGGQAMAVSQNKLSWRWGPKQQFQVSNRLRKSCSLRSPAYVDMFSLCWLFCFVFSFSCFSRVPRSGCWAGFMNPPRLCSKSHWLCCLTEAFLVFSLHKADSPSYLLATLSPGHLFSMLLEILMWFSIYLV